MEDALAEAVNKNMVVVNLLEALGEDAKAEEIVEGMEAEEEEEDAEEPEYDEHVWPSLRNTARLCSCIRDALVSVDPAGKELYTANTEDYIGRLNELDQKYQSVVDAAPVKTLLFCYRFPFRYMTDDYGISYYAAFAGCSAETEASCRSGMTTESETTDTDSSARVSGLFLRLNFHTASPHAFRAPRGEPY